VLLGTASRFDRKPPPTESPKRGALVLSCATAQNAPKFFSVFALCLRAADWDVTLLRENPQFSDTFIERWEIPYHRLVDRDGATSFSAAAMQQWKLGQLRSIAAEHGSVIWIDDDLGRWQLAPVEKELPGVVTLNWTAVSQKMRRGGTGMVGLG